MRDDTTKDESFKQNDAWRRQKYQNEVIVKSPRDASGDFISGRAFTTNSLSGNERNRTFLRVGDDFADISTISGADDLDDGRSFSLIDYDQDGWMDLAVMTLNTPRFKLFRNRFGEIYPQRSFIKIKLIGGNDSATASFDWSSRDGVGAKVQVSFRGGQKMMLQRQAGEGFAGQNSKQLHVGLEAGESVSELTVFWPSGKTSTVEQPESGKVCVIRESEAADSE